MDDDHCADGTVGSRIRLAREAAGITARDLARQLGVRLRTLQDWEAGRAEPRANRITTLAGLLNVPLAWLLAGRDTDIEDLLGPPTLAQLRAQVRALQGLLEDAAHAARGIERRLAERERVDEESA
ncbi:MAG: helix-turn-helix transcriptional regulator [Ectothiorhodospiraceae bacterium]|nr:helix-turn-helix transcriptional regulator [Chromatiales bacterium]MCP5154441.1 helix-turn-helix transcriptional regulator [Ectothiorhodospiraceae bacterium]